MVELKRQFRKLKRSHYKRFELFQLLYAYIFRPKNLFISSKVRFINKGTIITKSPFYFGVFSNWLMGSTGDRGVLKLSGDGRFTIGHNVRISAGCRFFINGVLEIGDNTFIGTNSKLLSTTSIKIGSDCAISWNCQVADSDMHFIAVEGKKNINRLPVIIGNKVWIGSNCTIMKGVSLGDGTVVAAGSVVTQSFPAKSLLGGVPAKIIRENVEWQE